MRRSKPNNGWLHMEAVNQRKGLHFKISVVNVSGTPLLIVLVLSCQFSILTLMRWQRQAHVMIFEGPSSLSGKIRQ